MTGLKMVWNSCSVMNTCIKWSLYTHGDTDDYTAMLSFVEDHEEVTPEIIEKVAKDICRHSTPDLFINDFTDEETAKYRIDRVIGLLDSAVKVVKSE